MIRTTCTILLLALSVSVSVSVGGAGGDALPPQLAEARSLLAAGQAAEALGKAREGLERAPQSPALLDVASRAAQAAGSNDEALWYAAFAAQALIENPAAAKEDKTIVGELPKRLAELDPTGQKGPATLAAYASALCAIGKDCSGDKLYVNAVDLLTRCRGTSAAATAEAELAKIYDNKKAVEAVLASGLDVPIKAKKKRSPETIAREDAKHSSWANPWEIKGPQYTIKTDMGLEMAESMSLAMEQMNAFYRKVFHIKEHGGGQTARVTICVYKTRAEFDENEKDGDKPFSPGVKGFFSPSENRVVTYDPRSEERSLAFLWSTLFHESSHQFTDLMAAGEIPTWLNEGTASYFEGAKLQPNGRVKTNLVAEERLGGLKGILDKGSPTLKELVSYFKPGSYPGEYYYPGWGLAYFLQNYEDERSQRVYLKPYQDFMTAYGKSAAQHDVFGRFVEYFVTKPKQPGVETFEAFEKRWKGWILKLHANYFGGPEVADELIARARKQLKDKAVDAAQETYEWALRKRPGDPVASFELAELLAAQKQNDAALYRYRAAVDAVRTSVDPSAKLAGSADLTGKALLELAAQQVAKLDKGFCDAKAKADADFPLAAAEAARGYAGKDMPLNALTLLDLSLEVYGPSKDLADLRREIFDASKADTRRWRRPSVDAELVEWEAGDAWTGGEGVLSIETKRPAFCMSRGDLPERYAFEARIVGMELPERSSFLALNFGANDETMQCVRVDGEGRTGLFELDTGLKQRQSLAAVAKDKLGSFTVTIDVQGDKVEVFLDGKSAGKPREYEPEDLRGRVGFLVQGGSVKISDVRVRY